MYGSSRKNTRLTPFAAFRSRCLRRYGSSSSEIWLLAFGSKVIHRIISSTCIVKVVVFGSSIGLIPFYWAVQFSQVQCTGYEILPILVDSARKIQEENVVGEGYRSRG
jgi:hypothetical protein